MERNGLAIRLKNNILTLFVFSSYVTMDRKNLLNILLQAQIFTSSSANNPILQHIYLWKKVLATDMERYFSYDFDTWLDVCVSMKIIDILKLIEDDEVELLPEWNKMKIIAWKNKFTVDCMPSNTRINAPEVLWDKAWIDWYELISMISNVDFVAPDRYTPAVIATVNVQSNWWIVDCAWTDSISLLHTYMSKQWADFNINIPKRYIKSIKKIIPFMWESDVYIDSNKLKIVWWWYEIIVLLLNWWYPNYKDERLMPKEFNYSIIVNKDELIKCIQKITLYTKTLHNYCKLTSIWWELKFSDNVWLVETYCKCSGNDYEICFNSMYLLNFAQQSLWDIEIKIVNDSTVFVVEDKWRANVKCVIKPLHLQKN